MSLNISVLIAITDKMNYLNRNSTLNETSPAWDAIRLRMYEVYVSSGNEIFVLMQALLYCRLWLQGFCPFNPFIVRAVRLYNKRKIQGVVLNERGQTFLL